MEDNRTRVCYGCENSSPIDEMERIRGEYVCQSCVDKLDDKTGYCSLDCQLGNGCDDSC